MDKLVSIVVPVYNMGNSIEVCLESIRKQTYKNIEIILVDDGSTDNTYQKCQAIAETDSRVVVHHTENRGAGPARNYGIAHSNGEYIYFPDADDYLAPDTLALCVAATENGKYDTVVFGFQTLTRDGRFLWEQKYSDCGKTGDELRRSYSESFGYSSKLAIQGAPWNKFFNADVIRSNGLEFPALRRHQDEAFISRYMCFAQNVHFIENVLYFYYENDLNNQWQKFPNNYIDIVIGLYAIRKETVLTWNPADHKTHEMVEIEYLSKIVKALELSYSPKMKMDNAARRAYFHEVVKKSNLMEHECPANLGKYQREVCKNLMQNKLVVAQGLIRLKVWMDKTGLIRVIKDLLHK